uniref:Dynamin-A n=1 Tax=Lygus hesperus TaxID=30085 RepID=A0A0A9W568_LYGHE
MASRLGTQYLIKRLCSLLFQHLQTYLPVIRQQILTTIQEIEKELESYGMPLDIENARYNNDLYSLDPEILLEDRYENLIKHAPVSPSATAATTYIGNGGTNDANKNPSLLGPMLLELLSTFASLYNETLDGRTNAYDDISTHKLLGGARISYVFHDIFASNIDNIDPFDYLTDTDIRIAIRNATGPRPTLFLPEISFELLVKKQIERVRQPCVEVCMCVCVFNYFYIYAIHRHHIHTVRGYDL